jgi:hypothetical protein
MRTIVFSDVHGEPGIIRGVIEHSGYAAGDDRLVFAGDAIDIGRDSAGCLALLDELGAEFLVGNHEWGAFIDWGFEPLAPDVDEAVMRHISAGDWPLAAEADGVLITHAGVSATWASVFAAVAQCEVAGFVRALNAGFRDAVDLGVLAEGGVVADDGPLWWRPRGGDAVGLPGVAQVCGHTPHEILAGWGLDEPAGGCGLYLVDPWVRGWEKRGFCPPTPVRYAVIEGGDVRVIGATDVSVG